MAPARDSSPMSQSNSRPELYSRFPFLRLALGRRWTTVSRRSAWVKKLTFRY